MYAEVPACLQGYVELVYDLNNHPSFRLIEPLLYKSPFYDQSMQTVMLSEIARDDRPFVLSTPRLEKGDSVQLQTPFASEQLDALFRMKNEPSSFTAIRETLNLNDEDAERFRSFLTTDKPRPYAKYDGDGARWRYFGHACILFETRNVSILMDPVLSYTYESDVSRYTYEDLAGSDRLCPDYPQPSGSHSLRNAAAASPPYSQHRGSPERRRRAARSVAAPSSEAMRLPQCDRSLRNGRNSISSTVRSRPSRFSASTAT